MGVEEKIGFRMKTSFTLPSLADKNFNVSRDENDKSNYSYTYPFMKIFYVLQLSVADVMVLINFINLKILMRFLLLFQKS